MGDESNTKDFDPSRAELFEALGHPIRIRILQALNEGPLGFSELKRKLGVESSGHLQFHLSKLDGLIKTSVNGGYTLTDEGREALRIVTTSGAAHQGNGRSGDRKVIISREVLAVLVAALLLFASVAAYQEYALLSGDTAATAMTEVWTKNVPLFVDGGGLADQNRFYGVEDLSFNETHTGPSQGIFETFSLDAFALADGSLSWQVFVTFRNYFRTSPHLFFLDGDVCLTTVAAGANATSSLDGDSVSLVALRYNATNGALVDATRIPMTQIAGQSDFLVGESREIYAAYVQVGGIMSIAAYGGRSGLVGNISVGGGNGWAGGDDSAFATPHHLIVADGWSQQAFGFTEDTRNLTWSGPLPGFVVNTKGTTIGETLYYQVPTGSHLNLYGMDFSAGEPTLAVNVSLSLLSGSGAAVTSLGGLMLLCSGRATYEAVSPDGSPLWQTNLAVQSAGALEGITYAQPILFPDGRILLSYIGTSVSSSDYQKLALVDSLTGRLVLDVPWPTWVWPWQASPSYYFPLASSGNLLLLQHGKMLACVDTSRS